MMAACATVRIVGETAPSPPPRSGASPSLLPPHVCGPPPSARYKSSHACHTRRATPDVRFLRLRAHAPGVLFVWVRGGDAQGAAGQRAAGQAWRARTGWTVCQRRADAAFPAVPITGRREPECAVQSTSPNGNTDLPIRINRRNLMRRVQCIRVARFARMKTVPPAIRMRIRPVNRMSCRSSRD